MPKNTTNVLLVKVGRGLDLKRLDNQLKEQGIKVVVLIGTAGTLRSPTLTIMDKHGFTPVESKTLAI